MTTREKGMVPLREKGIAACSKKCEDAPDPIARMNRVDSSEFCLFSLSTASLAFDAKRSRGISRRCD